MPLFAAAEAPRRQFDVPAGDASETLKRFAQQAGHQIVYPAHDYRGNTSSTIGQEKRANPRVAGRTRDEYVDLMASLNFPLPEKIQEVLQPNQTAIEDDKTRFPDLAQLNSVRQLNAQEVSTRIAASAPPFVLDVREPQEYTGELGHIRGATLNGQPFDKVFLTHGQITGGGEIKFEMTSFPDYHWAADEKDRPPALLPLLLAK